MPFNEQGVEENLFVCYGHKQQQKISISVCQLEKSIRTRLMGKPRDVPTLKGLFGLLGKTPEMSQRELISLPVKWLL